jgi:Family of unknown function (DUF6058)
MSAIAPASPLGPLSAADLQYIRQNYLPLGDVCRLQGIDLSTATAHIRARRLPLPSYALEDGTPMFPRDFFALLDSAGSIDALTEHFLARYEAIARSHSAFEPQKGFQEWDGYLSGEYGVCLRQVTPETIFLKERLVTLLEEQLKDARPDEKDWRARLSERIRALDALERPFTACDRLRFGRPSSRERLIDGPRKQYRWLD